MTAEGMKPKAISEALGISIPSVYRYRKGFEEAYVTGTYEDSKEEALQQEALRRQFIHQQNKKGFEMGDSAKDLKSDLFKTIRAVARKNMKTGGKADG